VVARDPGVAALARSSAAAAATLNTGRFFISLKPREERKSAAIGVISRLRPQLAQVQGVNLSCSHPGTSPSAGVSRGQFNTLQDASLDELNMGAEVLAKLKTLPELADVSTDQQAMRPCSRWLSIGMRQRASESSPR
jgi:multidrug efflux pump subunit AcrB